MGAICAWWSIGVPSWFSGCWILFSGIITRTCMFVCLRAFVCVWVVRVRTKLAGPVWRQDRYRRLEFARARRPLDNRAHRR